MLSKNLKSIRQAKGYSRPQLEKLSGVDQRTIEFIENEKRKEPRITTVEKLAKALDVTVNDLIEWRRNTTWLEKECLTMT